jgi:hypothetical protein
MLTDNVNDVKEILPNKKKLTLSSEFSRAKSESWISGGCRQFLNLNHSKVDQRQRFVD